MRLFVAFISAYLLTAAFWVWRDMSETNIAREAFYIGRYRHDRRLLPLISVALFWFPATAHSFFVDRFQLRYLRRELVALSFFVIALTTVWLISN